MSQIRAIVLRAAGINCDLETQHAFELAGAQADRVHINRIIEDKSLFDGYQILVVPGGFSYGDDVAAGKILANQIKHHLLIRPNTTTSHNSLILLAVMRLLSLVGCVSDTISSILVVRDSIKSTISHCSFIGGQMIGISFVFD